MVNNFLDNSDNLLLDFETTSLGTISLEESQIQQAVAISGNILNPERQWQTYLEALAWFGFESWLKQRDSEIVINSKNCSLTQASQTHVIPGVFNLEVNQFKVCILTPGVMLDQTISIPRAVLDLPEYVAHFYVVVGVDEEREEATVNSFISYDELKQFQQSANLQTDSDWNYELPIACFNSEPDKLLLCLRCLETSAIVLPIISERLINIANLQTQLESLVPQLQSETTSLPKALTWEQAIPILTNPTLLDWLYNLKNTTATESIAELERILTQDTFFQSNLSAISQQLTETVINVGAWLRNELDEISQSLAWNLLPASALATSAFRDMTGIQEKTPSQELTFVVTELRDSGIEIPTIASGAYRDFTLGEVDFRLFAIAWQNDLLAETPEWTLLVVLGAQPQYELPQGLQLLLEDSEEILDEKIVETAEDSYLYTLVIGTVEEKFTIKVISPFGEILILPPFGLLN